MHPLHTMVVALRGLLMYYYIHVDNPHCTPVRRTTGPDQTTLGYNVGHLRYVCVGNLELWGFHSLEELVALDVWQIMVVFHLVHCHALRFHLAVRVLLSRRICEWAVRGSK